MEQDQVGIFRFDEDRGDYVRVVTCRLAADGAVAIEGDERLRTALRERGVPRGERLYTVADGRKFLEVLPLAFATPYLQAFWIEN